MQDRIEKSIELKASVARVWRALTDYQEFGEWFRVKLDGPFVVGEVSRGQMTYEGYEHVKWKAQVQAMEPERLFSFTWRPYADDPDTDYTNESQMLVEFRLEPTSGGCRLVISESGFSALPDDARRVDALRENTKGWDEQANNITAHVEG
ncbi:MAG: SRPBCC family protein [Pseudomonadales bacterium]